MQCHYCDREADVAVEKDGLKVGVCADHFRERMDELADADLVKDLDGELDLDSTD